MRNLVRLVKPVLLILVLGLLFAGAPGCSSECGKTTVDWVYGLDDALAQAQSANKPVMMAFYAGWCPSCKRMDCETYTNEELGAFINENFAPLKVNVDKSSLGGLYGISAIPQVVFLSPQGTEIGDSRQYRVLGYLTPVSFQEKLQAVLDAWNSGVF